MSYVIHIWEEAAPKSLQQADQLHERLAGTAAPANPKFLQLAQALVSRFPAEVGGRGEGEDHWVESPPDGRTETRVYSLGLYDAGAEQLLPVLVETATALGLTVYDDQAGCAWLPGGWVLDEEGRHRRAPEPEPSEAPLLLSVARARALFKTLVLPALSTHGFKMEAHRLGLSFTRQRAVGEQRLMLELRDAGGWMDIKPSTVLYPALPPAINALIGPGVGGRVDPVSIHARHCRALVPFARPAWEGEAPDYPVFTVTGEKQAEAFAHAYLLHLQDTWLPLLDAMPDAPGLLDCDRRPEAFGVRFGSSYSTLALAYWVGVADFDTFVAEHAARLGRAYPGLTGLVRGLNDTTEKIKARPDLFGTYPGMG